MTDSNIRIIVTHMKQHFRYNSLICLRMSLADDSTAFSLDALTIYSSRGSINQSRCAKPHVVVDLRPIGEHAPSSPTGPTALPYLIPHSSPLTVYHHEYVFLVSIVNLWPPNRLFIIMPIIFDNSGRKQSSSSTV